MDPWAVERSHNTCKYISMTMNKSMAINCSKPVGSAYIGIAHYLILNKYYLSHTLNKRK